ncbi:C-type lectin domain family 4 member M-like [Myxocyprinus asiaticus]|uniref:C-type lectin domain family 4 member M-like n=1 Tax=Myxocyprinus asiaticus TaxID=70543 RepID=UPI0022227B67|nr:C-type lectin domain family 4 member M-like [Myxocyprinus asiaticus]
MSRAASVCVGLLCVLLLATVIVLCVQLNTNKNLMQERDKLLLMNMNLTKEREILGHLIQENSEQWKHLHEMDEWIYYHSSLYYISSEMKSWSESRKYCTERGADLLIINNINKQKFVTKVTGGNNIWIGLTDSADEGTWKWVNGSTLTSGFWKSGQPNGQRIENCAVSYLTGWFDYSCNNAYKWICEKSL